MVYATFVLAATLAGLLSVRGFHEAAVLRWIPYSGLEFFLLFVPLFMGVGLGRARVKSATVWVGLLEALNLFYLIFFFPQPVALAFSAAWFWAVLSWRKRERRFGWALGLLLLLPLMLKHSTHEITFWGLSYATFRAFHLFMDDRLLKSLRFRDYFTFTFFFPALLAGPIDRWPRFQKALHDSFTAPLAASWSKAFWLMSFGLLQKFVLGEAIRRYVLPTSLHDVRTWVTSFYAYPLYLYLDFAGYSAMAIGFALLVGLELPINFDRPFLATNPQDFWRRFHISLGEWLSDYFFKPIYKLSARFPGLGPLARQNVALFLTFLAMGLWNGVRTQYVTSGALFGLYSVVHNTSVYRKKRAGVVSLGTPVGRWVARIVMLHLAALALFLFSGAPFQK